jgi:putative glutamine amidotransferase
MKLTSKKPNAAIRNLSNPRPRERERPSPIRWEKVAKPDEGILKPGLSRRSEAKADEGAQARALKFRNPQLAAPKPGEGGSAIPTILVAPSTEREGAEFADWSLSLSNRYTDALIAAGALPVVLPASASPEVIAEAVRRSDGVLLTGGDDIDPKCYASKLPEALARTSLVHDTARDSWEKLLIEQVFQQRKPLFGICRGQQMLNVALGGSLLLDIPSQVPNALNHNQMARKTEPVHTVTVVADSLLAKIAGATTWGVNSTHHQAVGRVAGWLRAVAHSADGVIEALELKDPGQLPFLLTVQFHPERMVDGKAVFLQLFRSFVQAAARRNERNL